MTVKSLLIKDSNVQEAKILADAAPNMRNPNSIPSLFLAKTSADISNFFEAGNQKVKKK